MDNASLDGQSYIKRSILISWSKLHQLFNKALSYQRRVQQLTKH